MSNLVDSPQHEYGEEQLSTADSGGIDAADQVQDPSQEMSDEEMPPSPPPEKSYEEMRSNPSPEKSYEDMRSSPRKKYQCNQRIGPMHGGLLPTTDEYFNVECNDISKGGISFYLKRPPGCEQFAVVLGQKPQVTILVAKVVNTKEVRHDHQQMYLVGCQFIDRLPQ